MNLYISDLHFGHRNVILFDHRPFADVDEMDRCLIKLWNSRVSKDDNVYIVGDFAYKSDKPAEWYLRQLKGKKHLIFGNHDQKIKNNDAALSYFESVDKICHVVDWGKQIVLCHYPIADWYKGRHSSWHIYGHIHGNTGDVYQFMAGKERCLNAAACINNYTPASFNELMRNNEVFNRKNYIPNTPKDFDAYGEYIKNISSMAWELLHNNSHYNEDDLAKAYMDIQDSWKIKLPTSDEREAIKYALDILEDKVMQRFMQEHGYRMRYGEYEPITENKEI